MAVTRRGNTNRGAIILSSWAFPEIEFGVDFREWAHIVELQY